MFDKCCRRGESENAPLNAKNYANLLGFIINVLFTYLGGLGTVFGGEDNQTVSQNYQLIITPAGKAFSIWSIIFLFQAIFAVVQMLPKYRGHPLVQSGVSFWYLSVCLFQSCWTILWAHEIIWASLVVMLGVFTSLVGLVVSQYLVTTTMLETGVEDDESGTTTSCCSPAARDGLGNFWLLKFPFEIHCGWITCATTLNFNIMFLAMGFSPSRQLASAIVTLAVLHAVALFVLYVPRRPNYTIPFVITWANFWIAEELGNPKQSIMDTFSDDVITAVRIAATSVAAIVLILVAIRLAIAVACKYVPFLQRYSRGGSMASTPMLDAETGHEVTSSGL